jgi:hypothetical protein
MAGLVIARPVGAKLLVTIVEMLRQFVHDLGFTRRTEMESDKPRVQLVCPATLRRVRHDQLR